jgi:Cytochrome b/b6/petB
MSDAADTLHRPAEPAPQSQGQRFWRALDERLGLSGLQYPIPEHANTLAYSLGGLSLICFVLLVATGIFLTQYYNPDPAAAHASVRHIITGVTGGDFLRAFHYWAAMAMIVLVGLHLLRVFVSAAYKRPRGGQLGHRRGPGRPHRRAVLDRLGAQVGPGVAGGPGAQHRGRQAAGPLRLLVRVHLRRHPPADPPVRGPHWRPTGPVHPGRGRPSAAGQAAQDGPLAVPQGPRARADPPLHPPLGRAGRPGPGPDRRADRPGGAAPRARAGAGGGPGGHQAALATAVGLPGRGLGGGAGILWATLAIFAALLLVPVLDRSPERPPPGGCRS